MTSSQPKKMILLYVLMILHKYSDIDNPLTINEIIEKIYDDFKMTVDRKTVKRNIKDLDYFLDDNSFRYFLNGESFYTKESPEIITEAKDPDHINKGYYYYLQHYFTEGELRIIIESLLFSKYITINNRKELIGKLKNLTSEHFKPRESRLGSSKQFEGIDIGNQEIFINIEDLDEAISKKRQVSFNYTNYEIKGDKLHPKINLDKDGNKKEYIINPYEIVSSNGKHYLICNNDNYDNVSHYRLDRMKNIHILDTKRKDTKEVKGIEEQINIPKHMEEHIYMYSGESISVTFKFKKILLNEIADWFGLSDIKILKGTEDEAIAKVTVNRKAIRKWALQYGIHAQVLDPPSLVEEIKEDIKIITEKYEDKKD